MEGLFDLLEQKLYELKIYLGTSIQEFCYSAGFWTRQYSEDDDGNILDYEDVITRTNLQDLSDHFGLEVDCLNW